MHLPKYKIIASFIVLVSVASILVHHTKAQLAQQSITITPPSIKLTVNPGDKKEGKLGIINDSNGDLSFIVGVYDFVVTDKFGTPQVLPYGTIANNKYSAANWIAAAPDGFTVKAHTRYNLNYFIQIPKDAGPGGHYAAIIYQPVGANVRPGSGARVNTQIATLAYIRVSGPINEFATATNFSTPSFQEYGPVDISTEIRNYGDIHINPQATITIKDLFGRTIGSSPIQDRNIFPGNVALVYKNTIGPKLMIGKFTASLVGTYGTNNNLPLVATVSFWVFPWRLASLILLVAIIIILALLLWRKKKRQQREIPHPNPTETKTQEPAKQ